MSLQKRHTQKGKCFARKRGVLLNKCNSPLPLCMCHGVPCELLAESRVMKKKRLGEVLCERGQIDASDLKKALQEQQGKAIHLGELLLQRKLVSKKDLAA